MKKLPLKALIVCTLCLPFLFFRTVYAQDSQEQLSQMLDLKIKLLESRLELLDTKMQLWESKPKEIDTKLTDLDTRISLLDFSPDVLNRKFQQIDSLVRVSLEKEAYIQKEPQVVKIRDQEPEYLPRYKTSIMLDPVRLFEGTFYLTYERSINDRFSAAASLMATYSTEQGLSTIYFENQSFAYFDAITNQYQPYEGEVIAGGGINLQFRNYLLANHLRGQKAPIGLYAAPQLVYRKNVITGHYNEFQTDSLGGGDWVEKEIKQHLNIFAGGVIIGYKMPLFKVLTIDIFAGGNIRLSKYKEEEGFTKYKNWFNLDFSGVSPVAGISIGILR